MAITALVEVKTQEGKAGELLTALEGMLVDTRNFDGFVDISVIQNQDDHNNIILVEGWESLEHYQKYLGWRSERGDMDVLASFLSEPPSIRHFDRK